jgi:hypothetical protein
MLRRLTTIDIVLASFALILLLRFPFDPDMWWHLKVGQDLLAGIFPYRDIYTWSMPAYPWVDHEWLTDVLMYVVQHTFGLVGLGLVFIGVTVSAYMLAARTGALIHQQLSPDAALSNSASWRLGAVVAIVGVFINLEIIGARAQMISLLGFSAVTYWIWQYLTGERKSLWIFVPVFWLWANLHGGFTLGLMVVGLTLVSLVAAHRFSALRQTFPLCLTGATGQVERIRHVALALTGSVAASLINPYTVRIYEEALRTGTDSLARSVIDEWRAVDFQSPRGLLLVALVFGLLWWMVLARRNRSAWHLLVMPVFVYLGFSSARHAAPLVIFVLPLVYTFVADIPLVKRLAGQEAESWFGIRRAGVFHYAYNASIVLISLVLLVIWGSRFVAFSTDMTLLANYYRYPRAAVEYLGTHLSDDDRIFNSYAWGGYLIWNLPQHRVYIDGRMPSWQTPSTHILADYAHIAGLSPDWMDSLRASGATLVLVDTESPLAAALAQTRTYQQVYRDNIAVIYRRTPS